MSEQATRCGTYAEYQAHRSRGEDPCDDCRAANNAYKREYLKARPEKYAATKRGNAARLRALWRLAELHPTEYRRLYHEEVTR